MSILERIYPRVPVSAQNLMVTMKGGLLNRHRKSGMYGDYLQEISGRRAWQESDYLRYQELQLRNLLAHAYETTSYYRSLLDSLSIHPSQISTLEQLRRLPILDKETVRARAVEFVARGKKSSEVSFSTTGTTGSPLHIVADKAARQQNYAFFDSFLSSVGVDPVARHIVLGGRLVVPQSQRQPPFWRSSKFQNALMVSTYHIGPKTVADYISAFLDFSPYYIESYPSALYLMARLADERNLSVRIPSLKAIITSAEKLFEHQRSLIERVFGAPVFDQYGNAEMACMVHQCAHKSYHVRSDYGILEVVDEFGAPVPKGEIGSVVCTGFLNYRMPLIRYRIGDSVVLSRIQSCPCGDRTPIVAEIVGREDDVIVCPDGRLVGRMSPVLKGFPVVESQFVQVSVDRVVVRVVPSEKFRRGRDIEAIAAAVQARLGSSVGVDVELVEKLEYGQGGKLKNVISLISS